MRISRYFFCKKCGSKTEKEKGICLSCEREDKLNEILKINKKNK